MSKYKEEEAQFDESWLDVWPASRQDDGDDFFDTWDEYWGEK